MRLSFIIFTEIRKLNTREMFGNHQIAKLNTRKMWFFSNREIKYPRNLIPLRYTNSSCIIFKQNVLILQNVPIPSNCILPTYSSSKMFQYLHIVYYRYSFQQNASTPPYCILPRMLKSLAGCLTELSASDFYWIFFSFRLSWYSSFAINFPRFFKWLFRAT